jgi:hypothetical protein
MTLCWSILAHRLSTGLFSGMALSVSLMGVPAIRKTSDPLPAWKAFYENGAKFAVSTVLTTAVAGSYNFYETGNRAFLLSTALHLTIIPITIFAMGAGIKRLYQLDTRADSEIRKEIEKWAGLHWIRTFFGVSAFLVVLLSDQKCLKNFLK